METVIGCVRCLCTMYYCKLYSLGKLKVNSVCELPNLFMQASACSEYLAKFWLGSRICFSSVAFYCLKFVPLLLEETVS